MKEFVTSDKWEGKTIDRVYSDDEEIIVSFTDGTYGRVSAEYEGEDATVVEEACYTSSVYACRRLHTIGVITDDELAQAEEDHKKKVEAAESKQRECDMRELKRLLAKYPDMKGGE